MCYNAIKESPALYPISSCGSRSDRELRHCKHRQQEYFKRSNIFLYLPLKFYIFLYILYVYFFNVSAYNNKRGAIHINVNNGCAIVTTSKRRSCAVKAGLKKAVIPYRKLGLKKAEIPCRK